MNIEKYTQNAQQAVMDCQNIAISEGHQMLDGEHLHMALLMQKDGLIPKLLKYMNVDATAMIADVEEELEKLPKVSGERGQYVFFQKTFSAPDESRENRGGIQG